MRGRFASERITLAMFDPSALFAITTKHALNPPGVRRSPSYRDAGAEMQRGLREERPMRKFAAAVIGSRRRAKIVAAAMLSLGVAGVVHAQCPAGGTAATGGTTTAAAAGAFGARAFGAFGGPG